MRTFALKLAGLVSVAALATATPALARPMDVSDLASIRHAGNLVVSPDGSTVAYTISVPRDVLAGEDDGAADTHLYVIRGNTAPELFIGGHGSISGVSFAPDSSAIHFRTRRDGDENTSLYSISLSGGEATKVFEFETGIGDYAVSPDGETLYFVARPKDDSEDYSSKGFKAYAFEEDDRLAGLWSVSLTEEDAEAEPLWTDEHVSAFDLSADGSKLVLSAAPTNLVDDSLMERDLFVVDASSGDTMSTIEMPGKLGPFEFSPSGDTIGLLGGADQPDTSDGVLMVADANTGELTQLTPQALQHIQDIDWLSDEEILAVAHRGVESALVVYDLEGAELRTFNTPSNVVVRSADIGGDQAVRFIADSPQHPREVFATVDIGVQKLSNHNTWLTEIDLGAQSAFTFTARDGREIEGVLITPEGEQPEDGWPLIMKVHGGPEAHDSDGWLTNYSSGGQIAAGKGYAVFFPNYRGSTGRGVAFAKEHQADYAGKEFNDLVDGKLALVEAGIVDNDRVGITGGSYGGYASMWAATALTEHFAASVPFVGISNQVSKFGTSDIPNEMHLVHSLKWPWEDNWMNLIERSPIFHAGQSTTPTLIMHGAEDTRVHPAQSLELHRSMKVRTDTPVRLVFYPGEGHGNRRAAARLDFAVRMLRWMDTYLAEDTTRDDPMPEFDIDWDAMMEGGEEESED